MSDATSDGAGPTCPPFVGFRTVGVQGSWSNPKAPSRTALAPSAPVQATNEFKNAKRQKKAISYKWKSADLKFGAWGGPNSAPAWYSAEDHTNPARTTPALECNYNSASCTVIHEGCKAHRVRLTALYLCTRKKQQYGATVS